MAVIFITFRDMNVVKAKILPLTGKENQPKTFFLK